MNMISVSNTRSSAVISRSTAMTTRLSHLTHLTPLRSVATSILPTLLLNPRRPRLLTLTRTPSSPPASVDFPFRISSLKVASARNSDQEWAFRVFSEMVLLAVPSVAWATLVKPQLPSRSSTPNPSSSTVATPSSPSRSSTSSPSRSSTLSLPSSTVNSRCFTPSLPSRSSTPNPSSNTLSQPTANPSSNTLLSKPTPLNLSSNTLSPNSNMLSSPRATATDDNQLLRCDMIYSFSRCVLILTPFRFKLQFIQTLLINSLYLKNVS